MTKRDVIMFYAHFKWSANPYAGNTVRGVSELGRGLQEVDAQVGAGPPQIPQGQLAGLVQKRSATRPL